MITIYNKLVRDNIPEIIEADGKKCVTEILSDEQYLKMVNAKLNEEVAEYNRENNLEELADILEVCYAVANALGYSSEDLDNARNKKANKSGVFDKKILLKEVVDK